VQGDPIKHKLKPRNTKRLKLKCDWLLSSSASKFNLRRCNVVGGLPRRYEQTVRAGAELSTVTRSAGADAEILHSTYDGLKKNNSRNMYTDE